MPATSTRQKPQTSRFSRRGAVGPAGASAAGWAIAEAIRAAYGCGSRGVQSPIGGSEMNKAADDVRLRQPFRQRGGGRAPCPRAATRRSGPPSASMPSSFPAPPSPRRAPRTGAPGSTGCGPAPRTRPTGAMRARRCSRPARADAPLPPNRLRWDPLAMPDDADRLRRRPRHDDGQSRPGRARGRRRPHLPRQCRHGGPLFLRRRRRAADHPRAGPARPPDRDGPRSRSRPARSP